MVEFNGYLVIALGMLLLSWIGHILEFKEILLIHESSVGILIGVGLGGLSYAAGVTSGPTGLEDDFFFNILLPPIIFAAAYSMKKKNFFNNFGAVIAFGVVGTIMTFFIVALIVFYCSELGLFVDTKSKKPFYLTFPEALQLAAVFSPTDSVSALSILDPLDFPSLHSVLAGEGIINDGVGIILLKVVLALFYTANTTNPVLFVTYEMILLTLGSAVVGVLVGLASALFLKHQPHDPHATRDMAIVFLFSYISYELSEFLELSGIITLFFCGVCMTHYTWYNMPKYVRYSSLQGARTLGFVAESFLFICLGAYVWQESYTSNWSLVFSLVVLFALLFARFVIVAVLCGVLNCVRHQKINFKMQLILWWGGLVRGAISFVLCLQINSPVNKYVMVTTTLTVAIFSCVVLASLTQIVVSYIAKTPVETAMVSHKSKAKRGFKKMDDYHFKPFFRKDWEPGQLDEADAPIDEFFGRSKTYLAVVQTEDAQHMDDPSILEAPTQVGKSVAPMFSEVEPLFPMERRRRSVSRSRQSRQSRQSIPNRDVRGSTAVQPVTVAAVASNESEPIINVLNPHNSSSVRSGRSGRLGGGPGMGLKQSYSATENRQANSVSTSSLPTESKGASLLSPTSEQAIVQGEPKGSGDSIHIEDESKL